MSLVSRILYLMTILAFQGSAQTITEKPAAYLREATVTQTAEVVRITANSPRPLLQTLEALQHMYGWTVGYEDPRYSSPGDVVEAMNNGSRTELPAGGEFSVEFPAKATDQEKTLRLIVDAYNQSKNPGRFELRRTTEGDFYVTGVAAHNEKGAMSSQEPLFDIAITLASQERSVADSLDLLCSAVAAQEHTTIVVGISPRSILEHTTAPIGGSKKSARELLIDCLRATHRNLYWRLLFNPAAKCYFLNIHSARPA
jgi:hypothetical protein